MLYIHPKWQQHFPFGQLAGLRAPVSLQICVHTDYGVLPYRAACKESNGAGRWPGAQTHPHNCRENVPTLLICSERVHAPTRKRRAGMEGRGGAAAGLRCYLPSRATVGDFPRREGTDELWGQGLEPLVRGCTGLHCPCMQRSMRTVRNATPSLSYCAPFCAVRVARCLCYCFAVFGARGTRLATGYGASAALSGGVQARGVCVGYYFQTCDLWVCGCISPWLPPGRRTWQPSGLFFGALPLQGNCAIFITYLQWTVQWQLLQWSI